MLLIADVLCDIKRGCLSHLASDLTVGWSCDCTGVRVVGPAELALVRPCVDELLPFSATSSGQSIIGAARIFSASSHGQAGTPELFVCHVP